MAKILQRYGKNITKFMATIWSKMIKRKAIKAGYQDNIMTVSGVESLINICKYNHDSEGHIYFTIMLIPYIYIGRVGSL